MAPRRKDETARDRVLDAALEHFARHGYHGVGVDAVAAAAGMAPSSLYNHFKGKREILLALIDREAGPLPDWPERPAPVRERLLEAGLSIAAMYRQNPAFMKVILTESVRDPEIGAMTYRRLLAVTGRLTAVLSDHLAGQAAPQLADAMARFFLGAVSWAAMALDVFGGRQVEPVDDRTWVALYVDFFLHGLEGGTPPWRASQL